MPAAKGIGSTIKSKSVLLVITLSVFSLAMATAIYFKQRPVTPELPFTRVILWQLVLWVPLVLVLPAMQWVIRRYKRPLPLAAFMLLFLSLHYGWFVGMSSLISPYLEYPRTRYGVYPFFFIFWTLIDIFLLSALLLFLVNDKKKNPPSSGLEESLYVKKGNKGILIKPDEIYWIGANDYYSDIYTSKGRFLERKSLKALMQHLPAEQFIRIHRSTVVNLQAISEFRPISGLKAEVKLQDGHSRTVSRTYLKPLKERLASARA